MIKLSLYKYYRSLPGGHGHGGDGRGGAGHGHRRGRKHADQFDHPKSTLGKPVYGTNSVNAVAHTASVVAGDAPLTPTLQTTRTVVDSVRGGAGSVSGGASQRSFVAGVSPSLASIKGGAQFPQRIESASVSAGAAPPQLSSYLESTGGGGGVLHNFVSQQIPVAVESYTLKVDTAQALVRIEGEQTVVSMHGGQTQITIHGVNDALKETDHH